MKKQEVRAIIERVGIVPVIRAASAEEARFAADCVRRGGVPIVEITMTVPGAVEVIRELVKAMPRFLSVRERCWMKNLPAGVPTPAHNFL